MLSGADKRIHWDVLNNEVDPARHVLSEEHIGVDAHNRENAMDALTDVQMNMVDKVTRYYAPRLAAPYQRMQCDNAIRQFILDEYQNAPAMHNGVKLPLEFNALLNQSPEVQLCYLNHEAHSAYRYFVLFLEGKLNPWKHPEADHLNNGMPEISEEYMQRIRAMWLAIHDDKFDMSEMHTKQTAKESLLNMFADLARVHNWDQKRPVMIDLLNEQGNIVKVPKTEYVEGKGHVVVEEEYDDQELDRPSCLIGVNTRSSQFIMLVLKADKNERMLNCRLIRDKFREEMLAAETGKHNMFNIIDQMDLPVLEELYDALEDFIANAGRMSELNDKQQALLAQLKTFNTQDMLDFIQRCKDYFGDFRFTQKLKEKVEYQGERYDNYGYFAIQCARDPFTIYYEPIIKYIGKRMDQLNGNKQATASSSSSATVKSNTVLDQDVEVLRQQLIQFALAEGKQLLFVELSSRKQDAHFIRQTANQYSAQIAEFSQAVIAPVVQMVEANQFDKAQADALKKVQASRQIQSAREAQIRTAIEAKKVAEERIRQQMIDYAFEIRAEALADRMLEATIDQVMHNMTQEQYAQAQAVLQQADRNIDEARYAFATQQGITHRAELSYLDESARIEHERRIDALAKAAEEARQRAEAEARRKAEEEARRKAEEEARRKAEEEARRKAEEEARRKAEEEARRKAEIDARQRAEEAYRRAEEEARKAEVQRLEFQRQQALAASLSQPKPAAVTPAFVRMQQVAMPALIDVVKPELLGLFANPSEKQLLQLINQQPNIIKVINSLEPEQIKFLITKLSAPEVLAKFAAMNAATKLAVLDKLVNVCPLAKKPNMH